MKTFVVLRTCAIVAALAIAVPRQARADDATSFAADTKRFATLRSFRLQIDSISPDAGISSERLAYVAPDSLRVDMPAKHFTAVIIGQYLWLRGRTGRWHRARMTAETDALAAVRETAEIGRHVSGKAVRLIGDATLHGDPMRVYEIAAPGRDATTGATERIWIGTRDGYPHRIEQRDGAFASTATYSSFNQLISVTQ